jgi:hypothetical protein
MKIESTERLYPPKMEAVDVSNLPDSTRHIPKNINVQNFESIYMFPVVRIFVYISRITIILSHSSRYNLHIVGM